MGNLMREQVCMVLNERESEKAKMAADLEKRLRAQNITVSRASADENLLKVISLKKPSILVLDYLLGDYTTGLDILTTLKSENQEGPKIIFLTDEPSISVAVSALTSGAIGYFEVGDPAALYEVEKKILAELQDASFDPPAPVQTMGLEDMLTQSKKFRNSVSKAQSLISQKAPLVFIHGPPGSGLSTFASAMVAARKSNTFVKTLDLHTFDGCFEETLGLLRHSSFTTLKLGSTLSLIIEHTEDDTGELLDILARNYKKLWPKELKNCNDSFVCLCSTSEGSLKTWQKLLPVEVVKLSPLQERSEDIPALAQQFYSEASIFTGNKANLKPEVLMWLKTLAWPGNLRQLKAVILDVACNPEFGKLEQRTMLEESIEFWENSNQCHTPEIDQMTAAMVLEMTQQNYRIAAAKLGCSPAALKNIVG